MPRPATKPETIRRIVLSHLSPEWLDKTDESPCPHGRCPSDRCAYVEKTAMPAIGTPEGVAARQARLPLG